MRKHGVRKWWDGVSKDGDNKLKSSIRHGHVSIKNSILKFKDKLSTILQKKSKMKYSGQESEIILRKSMSKSIDTMLELVSEYGDMYT